MFHVKHGPWIVAFRQDEFVSRETSLADTEVEKDDVKHVLHTDAPGDAAEGPRRQPQIFGRQFRGFGC